MKIFSFGCSFSTQTVVPTEYFWLDMLSKKLGCKYESWGNGGTDVHESFLRLTSCLSDFQKGDLIIYQFTDHNRIGYQYDGFYSTTAIFTRENLKETLEYFEYVRKVVKLDKSDEDYQILYEFSDKWADGQIFFHYWRVWNLLTFLKEKIGIQFVLLFLDQTWTKVIPERHYSHIPKFPIPEGFKTDRYDLSDPKQNVSLSHFIWNNKFAVAHEEEVFKSRGYYWYSADGHPGLKGHEAISSILYDHIINI